MNLVDTLRGLWRRWYIVIPGMLLTAAAAAGAWSMIPPGYERSSTQLLIPGALSMPDGANPYLFLGGLSPAADVLVRAVGSENTRNELVADYPDVEIEILRDTSTAGPVILIAVTAASDGDAREVLELLVDRTGTVLDELQETENIRAENRVTLLPITVDSQSVLDQRSRFIAVAATGLVGMTLTLLLAGLAEGWSASRARRRKGDDQPSDPGQYDQGEATAEEGVLATTPAAPPRTLDGPEYDSERDMTAAPARSVR
ncbi:hypothetical protein K2F54_05565 [Cryobacterium sp. 1639]|uniref:hypothetical protein n=1 Tax=Cryobacterium inferilacus TaxID=2866629 RepID=UPI001C737D8B|nr:hypothetical protein [Cryobacterium sp. 1639]MBX0299441.1 hypothetical protein [Cryobacterium sp. 1639]